MSQNAKKRRRIVWLSVAVAFVALVLNVIVYVMLPNEVVLRFGRIGYLGAFIVAAIANATVFIPVPYYPVIARLAQVLNVWGVILAAAAGSALGESVAFFVGRSGRRAVQQTQINHWMQRQMQHPWRAGVVLFAFSALPNPAFDVAGLIAGAFGVPLWLFLAAVFLGRIIRMSLVVFAGLAFDWFLPQGLPFLGPVVESASGLTA
jgi:membrane protein YqaA with SNARE-associated domain